MRMLKALRIINWRYIIFEILLVTIGILIAFQVDRWRENRKEERRENVTLQELKTSLEKDLEILELTRYQCDKVLNHLQSLQLQVYNRVATVDSMQANAFFLTYGFHFQQRVSAYENLKLSGIDLITNDSVRLALIELYDYRYPREIRIIDIDANNSWTRSYMEQQVRWDSFKRSTQDGQISARPIIHPQAFKSPDFLHHVTTRIEEVKQVRSRFIRIKDEVEQLINMIETELRERWP